MTEKLTNETLKGICKNNFELAHFAINLGRYYMNSGREMQIQDILKEMRRHPNPNYVEELKQVDEIEREARERNKEYHEG